jgi:hypothetical protein
MSRSLDSPSPHVGASHPSENLKQKATADMEIARQQMDLIASGLTRFAWQHSLN